MKKPKIETAQIDEFLFIITEIKNRLNCSYMDAITNHCEEHDLEIETVAPLVEGILKLEIGREANNLNLLKYSKKQPNKLSEVI